MRLSVSSELPVSVNVPTEILLHIFSNLPGKAVKNVRLVCKDFEAAASWYLFPRVIISPLKHDLQIFTNVMHHPLFSKTVREIVWNDISLRTDCTIKTVWDSWLEQHSRSGRYFSGGMALSCFDRHHRNYCQVLAEFEAVAKSGEDFETLSRGLKLMSRVDSISINDDCSEHGGVYDTSALFGPAVAPLPTVPWRNQPGQVRKCTPQYRGFRLLMRAISLVERESKIKKFRIDSRIGMSYRGIPRGARLVGTYITFTGLVELELRLNLHHYERRWQSALGSGRIAIAISAAAPSIKYLDLTFSASAISPDPLQNIIGTRTFPNLQVFNLNTFHLNRAELLVFFQNHSQTLRNVVLRNVVVSSANSQRHFRCTSLSGYALKEGPGEMETLLRHSGRSVPYPPRMYDEDLERFNNLLREASARLRTLLRYLRRGKTLKPYLEVSGKSPTAGRILVVFHQVLPRLTSLKP